MYLILFRYEFHSIFHFISTEQLYTLSCVGGLHFFTHCLLLIHHLRLSRIITPTHQPHNSSTRNRLTRLLALTKVYFDVQSYAETQRHTPHHNLVELISMKGK